MPTSSRKRRPPSADSSWYFSTRRATAFARSSLNALRSAAFAKRTSLCSVSDGSFFPAFSARSRSTASSRIVRAAAATR